MMSGIDAIYTFYRDSERTAFGFSYPSFFFQIPEMKLKMLRRTAQQTFKLLIANARISDVLSAFGIKNRHQLSLNVDIAVDAFTVAGFLDQFPAEIRMVIMLTIVLRALNRIPESTIGFRY